MNGLKEGVYVDTCVVCGRARAHAMSLCVHVSLRFYTREHVRVCGYLFVCSSVLLPVCLSVALSACTHERACICMSCYNFVSITSYRGLCFRTSCSRNISCWLLQKTS